MPFEGLCDCNKENMLLNGEEKKIERGGRPHREEGPTCLFCQLPIHPRDPSLHPSRSRPSLRQPLTTLYSSSSASPTSPPDHLFLSLSSSSSSSPSFPAGGSTLLGPANSSKNKAPKSQPRAPSSAYRLKRLLI